MAGEVEQLAERIRNAVPNIKTGSLRFWGVWFGRPYDNCHCIVGSGGDANVLHLYFNEDEILSVWAPNGLTLNRSTFQILDAERVRWEWFYYGRPKIDANRRFLDLVKSPG